MRSLSSIAPRLALGAMLALPALAPPLTAADLAEELGRNEVRITTAPYPLAPGRTVESLALVERLERLGYRRVHERPSGPGEYFWGHEVVWVYRRAFAYAGARLPAERIRLDLGSRGGLITRVLADSGATGHALALEPELLAESFAADRAPRRSLRFEDLPERVWRPLLAAEDARFFAHPGIDGIAIARALLANLRAGGVAQGGSTITQQLVKMRDLSPRRSVGRKASEALRALALEAEHSKEEILEDYLGRVYCGHLEGIHLYGFGAAARAFYDRDPRDLTLGQAAVLAALVQGPNGLSPARHPDALAVRWRWVLSRLEELGWGSAADLAATRRAGLPALRLRVPEREAARHYRDWLLAEARDQAGERVTEGRGFVVEGTLDPLLQGWAEEAVDAGLAAARARVPGSQLGAALVALDAATGDVLAYVGGPSGDGLDRARTARRQPGSTVKPLAVVHFLNACGTREPLHPLRRIADAPLSLDLPSGPWSPVNADGRFRGTVTLEEAVVRSLNVPLVRAARWCGFDSTAASLQKAGLEVALQPPPSFVLGAIETSPLALAGAYTLFAGDGRAARPRGFVSLALPSGRRLAARGTDSARVASRDAAFLARQMLERAVEEGTAAAGDFGVAGTFGKTGTSSERRDAWFAGGSASVVTTVWVGRDDGSPLGLTGAEAAAPIWRRFMERAAAARPPRPLERPPGIVEHWVETATGLRVRPGTPGARPHLFERHHLPPRRRWWRLDPPEAPLE